MPFVTDMNEPERATKTQGYDSLRSHQDPGSTICYGQEWARKSQKEPQEPGVRCVTDKYGPERSTKTREYDLLRIRVGQKEPYYDLLRIRMGQTEPARQAGTI